MHSRDRRRFARVSKRLPVEYTIARPQIAEIADLGEGGAFMVTANPLPMGTRLTYKFRLPGDPIEIEGEAEVTRVEPKLGMAIEFKNLGQEDRERIRAWALLESGPGTDALPG